MAKLQISWWNKAAQLSEIYQQTGIQFAFLSAPRDGSKQCHPWVKCRDFLHDALRASINGNSCGIYGFGYNAKSNPPIDLKRTRMLVRKAGIKKEEISAFTDKMKRAKKMLNHYEKLAGATLTKIYRVDEGKDNPVWLFNGPAFWQKAPYLISMYTFIIRLGDKEIEFKDNESLIVALEEQSKKPKRDNDQQYLSQSFDKLHVVAKRWKDLFGNNSGLFDNKIHIDNYHNRAGIRSLCMFSSPDNELNNTFKKMLSEKQNA